MVKLKLATSENHENRASITSYNYHELLQTSRSTSVAMSSLIIMQIILRSFYWWASSIWHLQLHWSLWFEPIVPTIWSKTASRSTQIWQARFDYSRVTGAFFTHASKFSSFVSLPFFAESLCSLKFALWRDSTLTWTLPVLAGFTELQGGYFGRVTHSSQSLVHKVMVDKEPTLVLANCSQHRKWVRPMAKVSKTDGNLSKVTCWWKLLTHTKINSL